MRLDIRYRTAFRYEAPVTRSHTQLRAVPTSNHRQQVHHQRVTTVPDARVVNWTDYWGTRVDAFGIARAHDSLEITCEATVETTGAGLPIATVRRSSLLDPAFRDQHVEFLGPSRHVTWDGPIADVAGGLADAMDDDVTSLVLAWQRALGERLTYAPGATDVTTTVEEAFEGGEGVCQDYAHCLIAMCRSAGVPARYVSGYFFAAADDDGSVPVGEEAEVETHAWVEVALPGYGWWALDPTNQLRVGERHVVIGRGRDYADVAPLRGTFAGAASHESEVSVHLRVLAEQHQQQQ